MIENQNFSPIVMNNQNFMLLDRYLCRAIMKSTDDRFMIYAIERQTSRRVIIKKISYASTTYACHLRLTLKLYTKYFLEHENIKELVDIYFYHEADKLKDIYVVTEKMDCSLKRIIRSKGSLTDDHCKSLMYQIIRRVYFIHSKGLSCLSITSKNFFLNINEEVKFNDPCDSILFTETFEPSNLFFRLKKLAPCYMAPEIICGSTFSQSSDIWSLGCVFAEIMLRKDLFSFNSQGDMIDGIVDLLGTPDDQELISIGAKDIRNRARGFNYKGKADLSKIFPMANELALDLLQKMLVYHPQSRISALECLKHPYFQDYFEEYDETIPACSEDWTELFALARLNEAELLNKLYALENLLALKRFS